MIRWKNYEMMLKKGIYPTCIIAGAFNTSKHIYRHIFENTNRISLEMNNNGKYSKPNVMYFEGM